jgi:hypothetical protein
MTKTLAEIGATFRATARTLLDEIARAWRLYRLLDWLSRRLNAPH